MFQKILVALDHSSLSGWVFQQALDLAKTNGAIDRHGRSGLSELLLGSVSNYVVHHAPCSVLTIHPLAA